MKYFLRGCILFLMVYLVHSNGDADKDVREPTESSKLDQPRDLRSNLLDVLFQQHLDAHRKRDLDMIQALAKIHTTMKNLEERIDSLTLDNQSWKAQLHLLTLSIMADQEETRKFRCGVEAEIQNLKDQQQNITPSKPAEDVVQVEPNPAKLTEDANQLQSFSTTEEPETETARVDQEWLNDMLTNPYAKLYSGENFTGQSEWYRSENSNSGHCHRLGSLSGTVKSVETFGKCIRLFWGSECSGWSLAVYPGSAITHYVLNSKLLKVDAVGPCLEEEFQGSTFQDARKGTVQKNPDGKAYVPDLIEFYSHEKYAQGSSPSDPSNPILRYTLGPKNRVEFLHAYINLKHLNNSQPTGDMRKSRLFRTLEQEDGDVVGYGIPPSLGGPWDANYNIFPQTSAGSREWERIASGALHCLERDGGTSASIGLNFVYADDATTRPHDLYYWLYCYKSGANISYGRVAN